MLRLQSVYHPPHTEDDIELTYPQLNSRAINTEDAPSGSHLSSTRTQTVATQWKVKRQLVALRKIKSCNNGSSPFGIPGNCLIKVPLDLKSYASILELF